MFRVGFDARELHHGGVGRYAAELIELYPRLVRSEQVVVFAKPRDQAELLRRATDLEIVPVFASPGGLKESLEMGWRVRQAGLDLLHVPHYAVPVGVRCPLVVTMHDINHLRFAPSRWALRHGERLLARVRKRASLIIVPSQSVAADLEEFAGIEPERIRVIPKGVSGSWPSPEPGREVDAFLRRLRLERPYLLNVTNGAVHKGLSTVLQAYRDLLPRLLREEETGAPSLALVGQGSDAPEVLAQVEEAGLSRDRVQAVGDLSEREMRLAYACSVGVIVASESDGFGLPVLEGMAAGVPVVCADAGALPEVAGEAGILFPAGSVADLRDALYKVCSEVGTQEQNGRVALGLDLASRFTWESAARATLAAYERVLEGGN